MYQALHVILLLGVHKSSAACIIAVEFTVLAKLLWIFFEKKSEKLKYLKYIAHQKIFSVDVGETNEEENAKIAALHFHNCGRR